MMKSPLISLDELQNIVAQGESDTLELKKSTAQLRRAAESLCGMLNGSGGMVIIGVTPPKACAACSTAAGGWS